MATKTTKFITLSKLAKRKKKYVGTGGDGGLLTDKILKRNSSQSATPKTRVASGTALSNKQVSTNNEKS